MNNKNVQRRQRLHNKSNKNSFLKVILFTFISLLVIIISFTALFILLYKPSVDTDDPISDLPDKSQENIVNEEDGTPPVTTSDKTGCERKKDFYTFLVIGRDNVGLNTDIMVLVSFDIKNGAINIMQLPRDTYMKVDSSPHKLNGVYAIMHSRADSNDESDLEDAAMQDFMDLLEQNLSIKIDNYALCNIEGFRNIIDIIGGVEMDVPYDLYYSDPDQDLYIDLKQGLQTLDGDKAEQFIRYRSGYVQGDIGRLDAQKLFITALIKQVKESISVSTLTAIAGEAVENIKTSLSLADILYFVKEFYLIDDADIRFVSFPGTDTRAQVTSGASYYIMHRADMLVLLNEYFNVYENEITDSQFDADLAFTNPNLSHIDDIYNTELSEDIQEYVNSADKISNEGLDISLTN